jgi:hypothetical protein
VLATVESIKSAKKNFHVAFFSDGDWCKVIATGPDIELSEPFADAANPLLSGSRSCPLCGRKVD